MDRQQHVSQHEPLLSQQIHHIHSRGQKFEMQQHSIDPVRAASKCFLSYFSIGLHTFLEQSFHGLTWPKKRAEWASSTAWSTSASAHTIKGDFPPSSRVTGLRLLRAASSSIVLPVLVDPVNAICKRKVGSLIYHMRIQSINSRATYVSWARSLYSFLEITTE